MLFGQNLLFKKKTLEFHSNWGNWHEINKKNMAHTRYHVLNGGVEGARKRKAFEWRREQSEVIIQIPGKRGSQHVERFLGNYVCSLFQELQGGKCYWGRPTEKIVKDAREEIGVRKCRVLQVIVRTLPFSSEWVQKPVEPSLKEPSINRIPDMS